MRKMSCLAAALALCTGAALAQDSGTQSTTTQQTTQSTSGQGTTTTTTTTTTTWQNNGDMGAWRTSRHWDAADEAHYRIWRTLNATDAWAIRHELRMLPGSDEDLYYRAMNRASDSNGAWGGATWASTHGRSTNMNTTAMTGSENQTVNGESIYALSYMQRARMNDISDVDAYDLLLNGVSFAERGVINSTWPRLTETTQHAILTLIKRSMFVTPPTSDMEDRWWR